MINTPVDSKTDFQHLYTCTYTATAIILYDCFSPVVRVQRSYNNNKICGARVNYYTQWKRITARTIGRALYDLPFRRITIV